MTAARPRFPEGPQRLVDLLAPYATSGSWLVYCESEKDGVKPELLQKHDEMMTTIRQACPNLAFSKKTVDEAFKLILSRCGPWKVD